MSEDNTMDLPDDHKVTFELVRLHDGSRAYRLPSGVVFTPEAWGALEPRFRRALIDRKLRDDGQEPSSIDPATAVNDNGVIL